MSTLLHWLILSIELGTVQTGTGKVDPARKFKCTTAARDVNILHIIDQTKVSSVQLWIWQCHLCMEGQWTPCYQKEIKKDRKYKEICIKKCLCVKFSGLKELKRWINELTKFLENVRSYLLLLRGSATKLNIRLKKFNCPRGIIQSIKSRDTWQPNNRRFKCNIK